MEDFPSFQGLISGDIFTVSQINERIKASIDDEFGLEFVWIVGEVSNFRGNYASGHWYFSLKDENTQIFAVCFKWANQYIKFNPENGMEVICCGQINVYEKQGTYQINIRYIEPKGVGAQAVALEQLKEKLFAEGLFDESRKRELPFLPGKIGIVTSPTGAAVKDILKTLDRRFADLNIIISPARVQGKEAASDIAQALNLLYKERDLDEIIVARGGGAKEDLMVFNEESVVRTVAKSPVPVISAVGHEIDITFTDLAADVRA
nr:exodeoxyribonuclease VII large subunit [Candidatus Dadabacteria bacterium]NIS09545.1 exodeoxyribonuclease VII large subunit [Candidatus Dadabacteria bacterium]NIV43037.1 exodeoxyribonuclease VII large subunit [Candidatus Dadabacteria bacterium]NIY22722.1 exodeoxyribonuclease VII large subunit [Candidatus Dadabacteria bacterium]